MADRDFDIRSTVTETTADVGGVLFVDVNNVGSGTGNYDTFLKIGGNPTTISGYNTDDGGSLHPDNPFIGASQTETLLLANITSVFRENSEGEIEEYYQIRFDLNEPNSSPVEEQISIEEFRIYVGDTSSVITRTELEALDKVYDLDEIDTVGDDGIADNNTILMSEVSTGSGTDDYAIFIPVSLFGDVNPVETYVYFDVTMGQTAPVDTETTGFEQSGGFEEFNIIKAGYIFGTKFEDLNQDGIRNGEEMPLEGVRIYIDSNNDGMWNEGEKFDFSDENGNWFLTGVEADGTDLLVREEIPVSWGDGWEATNPDGVDANGAYWNAQINNTGDNIEIDIGNFRPNPSFTVEKNVVSVDPTGDDLLNAAGDIVNYEIVVTNDGNVALTDVSVTDPLLGGALTDFTGDVGGDGILGVGETWTYSGSYAITQDDLDSNATLEPANTVAGLLENEACVVASYDGEELEEQCDDADVPLIVTPDIDLVKTSDVAFIEEPGDINYTYTLTNTGNTAVNITSLIDDNFTPGNTGDDITLYDGAGEVSGDEDMDGLLDVGEIWTFTATVTVDQAQFEANDFLTNVACATTDIPHLEACDDETVEIRRYDIDILKEAVDVIGSDELVIDEVGDTAVYRITVTNEGNQALENVTVTDSLDPTVEFVSGDTNNDGLLDVDESWIYRATYTADQAVLDGNGININGVVDGDGDVDNRATVTADNVDPEYDDAYVPVDQIEGLDLVKTSETTTITGPQTVTYTFTVTNTGNYAQVVEQLVDLGFTDGDGDDFILYTDGDATSPEMGDTDGDGLLDVDETWTFSYDLNITQEMIEANPLGLRNVACVEDADGNLVYDDHNIGRYAMDIDKSVVSVDGSTTNLIVDEAGEQVLYDIAVSNIGNLALTGVTVTDSIADAGSVLYVSGDTDGNGDLDTDEIWHYTATYTATQGDLDTNGGGDGYIENVATADSNETPPVDDDARVPVRPNDELRLTKTVLDVGGDGAHGVADEPGDIITYELVATNYGNTTLTHVTIVDPLTGTNAGPVDLAPGETFTVQAEYTVTQEDIDTQGASADGGAADCDIDNTAVANSDQTNSVEASAEVMLDYDPSIDLEKLVSVNGGGFVDADLPTGPEVTVNGSTVTFRIELTNTGNVTLTDVALSDVNLSDGVPVDIDLSGYTIDGLVDADGDGQVDDLAVGGSASLEYTLSANPDQHINTATVTVAETTKDGGEVTDSDSAHYFGLIGDGPGVRTPGGWGNSWKLLRYWDGIDGNEPHVADDDNFPDAELSMDVAGLGKGIIIGGNFDDVLDDGEIFVDLETARDLLNGDTGGAKHDKLDDLARHAIATTLNALAGNNVYEDIPDDDVDAPIDWLNEAAAWLLEASSDNGVLEVANYDPGANIIRANSGAWRNGYETEDGDISAGRDILSALDEYNNTGVIDGVRYAHDADSSAFTTALEIAADEFLF